MSHDGIVTGDALQRMQERMDALQDVIFETDEAGRIVYINQAWHAMVGEAPSAAIGRPLAAYLSDAPVYHGFATSNAGTAGVAVAQSALLRADGERRWVRVTSSASLHGGRVGLMRDVTAEKAAQEELQRMSLVANATDNLVVIADHSGRIEWVNRAFEARTGYALNAIRGCKPGQLLQGPGTDRHAVSRIRKALRAGESVNEEILNYTSSGEPYWVNLHITPVLNAAGGVERFVSVQADTTDRRRYLQALLNQKSELEDHVQRRTAELALAREQAEFADRAKGTFIANVSHEIRTPLNAILGLTHLCLQTELSTRQKDYLDKILISSRHLMELISDVLDFSKIEAGSVRIECADFSLKALLSDIGSIFTPMAEQKGLRFGLTTLSEVPEQVVGDAHRIEQVLVNLCNNAIKFTPHGSVSVTCSATELANDRIQIRFEVKDTGIGISAEQAPHLFEAFAQADGSSTRHHGGTGLGLAISKRLAQQMDGDLGMSSELGHGSTFWFTVTLKRQTSETQSAAAYPRGLATGATDELRGLRVLVTEDNEFNQQIAYELLTAVGVRVTLASTGHQALDALALGGEFDAVLMDVQMPELNGLETARRIRAQPQFAFLPIIALTASATAEDRTACLAAGMNDFAPKPIEPSHLYATLVRWARPREHESPSAPSLPTVDIGVLASLLNNDREKVAKFARRFVETSSESLREMRSALQRSDLQLTGTLAHRTKSAAATIGARKLARVCEALEKTCSTRDAVESKILLAEVSELLRQASVELGVDKTDISA